MNKIKENFKVYNARKLDKDNDYAIWNSDVGGLVSTNCTPYTKNELKYFVKHKPLISDSRIKQLIESHEPGSQVSIPNVSLIKKEFIDRLHPDNLDSRDFWKEAIKNFPYYSIAGGNYGCKSPQECNEVNLNMANASGMLPYLNRAVEHFQNLDDTTQVLEIGPGYGNICFWLQDTHPLVEYYGIDVNPLFEWPTLYQTDGFTINKEVPNRLEIVYSCNVFQHLSKSQRTSYYKEIYKKLKPGGAFYFNMFILTENNKGWPVWGMKDYKGRYYTGFFKQFTEVDHIDELKDELEEIGFNFKNISWHETRTNILSIQALKPEY